MYNLEFTDEQKALVETARKFAREQVAPKAAELDEKSEFPHEICKMGFELGLMNAEVPEAYGGLGLSCLSHCLLMEEIAWACAGVNTTLTANNLGAMPLMIAGSEAQKQKYLGWLTRDPIFCAYACSEPDAGSDVAGMRTRYEKKGDKYILTGQKRWITNAGQAKWFTTFATTDPKLRHKGITCFVVPADLPGVKVGRHENKLGQRCSDTSDVLYEEVELGAEHLVGVEGEGFKVAMKTFDRSRPWIAAGAAGLIRRCLDESRNYALERKTFGVPIGSHQAVQFMIADMAIAYESTRLLCHKAAHLVDQGNLDSVVSSYAKAHGADSAMQCAIDAVQIFGGYGYTKEYPVEKLMRDAKLLQIYEGTSQIQRMVIARNVLGVR